VPLRPILAVGGIYNDRWIVLGVEFLLIEYGF